MFFFQDGVDLLLKSVKRLVLSLPLFPLCLCLCLPVRLSVCFYLSLSVSVPVSVSLSVSVFRLAGSCIVTTDSVLPWSNLAWLGGHSTSSQHEAIGETDSWVIKVTMTVGNIVRIIHLVDGRLKMDPAGLLVSSAKRAIIACLPVIFVGMTENLVFDVSYALFFFHVQIPKLCDLASEYIGYII